MPRTKPADHDVKSGFDRKLESFEIRQKKQPLKRPEANRNTHEKIKELHPDFQKTNGKYLAKQELEGIRSNGFITREGQKTQVIGF